MIRRLILAVGLNSFLLTSRNFSGQSDYTNRNEGCIDIFHEKNLFYFEIVKSQLLCIKLSTHANIDFLLTVILESEENCV